MEKQVNKNPSSREFGQIELKDFVREITQSSGWVTKSISPLQISGTLSFDITWSFFENPIDPENPSSRDFGKKNLEFDNWFRREEVVYY